MFDEDLIAAVEALTQKVNKISSKMGVTSEDLLLQYPNNASEMLIPASERKVTIERTINRRLKYLAVSIPANCTMTIYNDNQKLLFLCDESGTIQLPAGVYIGNLRVEVVNADTSNPARVNYKLVFGD